MKLQSRVSVNQINDNTCIKVYNPKEQKLIAVFKTFKKTAAMLGLTEGIVYHHCVNKTRTYSRILDMDVALRLSAIKDGDLERIAQCNRSTTLKDTVK